MAKYTEFKYTKANGEVSERTVFPLRIIGDKMLALDVSQLDEVEREEAFYSLEAIHEQYLEAIRRAGFGSLYRSFFLDKISEKK